MYGTNYQYGTSPSHQAQQGSHHGMGAPMDTNPSHRQMLQSPGFTQQNPPPRTRMEGIHPNVAQYGGAIAFGLFQAAMRSAQNNAAFMFFYNVNASQGYQGENWYRSVEFATMLLWSFMDKGGAGGIDNMIEEAVNATVIYKASSLAANNGPIMNAVDQGTRNDIIGYSQEHDRLRGVFQGMLTNFANQVHAHQNPQAAYGGIVGATLANNMTPGVNTSALYSHGNSGNAQPTVYGGGPAGIAPSKSTAKGAALYSFDDPIPEGAHTDGNLGSVVHIGGDDHMPQYLEQPVYVEEAKWVPNQDQPYLPLPYGGDSKVAYESITSRTGEPIILAMIQQKDEQDMNTDEYKIPVLNSMMQGAVEKRHGGDSQKIIRHMDLVAKGIANTSVREEPEVIRLFAEANMNTDGEVTDSEEIAFGLNHAISCAAQARLYVPGDQVPTLFNYKTTLVEDTIISKTDMTAIIESLASAGTYAVAASLLHQYLEECKDDAEALLALKKIDETAADAFNYVLQVGCGLQGYAIESFRTDVMEMVSQAGIRRGAAYSTAINKHARDFNKTVFGSMHIDEVLANGKPVGYRVLLGYPVIISMVDVDSESLRMALAPGEVKELFEANFPGLQPLLMNLSESNFKKGRNFFVTADGAVFGFDRSVMGEHIAVIYKV